jgi:ATP-binding cassette subfamily B protein
LAVLAAVLGSRAVKHLVDVLLLPRASCGVPWCSPWGDNLLWRLAGWVSTHAFVAVGGDMRLDLFDHLSGQGTRYFVERFPGALAGRITAAANAAWPSRTR